VAPARRAGFDGLRGERSPSSALSQRARWSTPRDAASHNPPVVELALLVACARGPAARFSCGGSLLPERFGGFLGGAQNKGRSRVATPFPSATAGRSTKLPAARQG
jgi:hypothetical protein